LKAYLEIGCLVMEDYWTGIAGVAAGITNFAVADTDNGIEWEFLFETIPMPRKLVHELLLARSGRPVRGKLPDLLWRTLPLDRRQCRNSSAIFTNIKPLRGYFGREAMVVHDLTTLLVPWFHNQDTIAYYANRIAGDVRSTSHFFCNSQATREDVKLYMGVAHDATSIIPLGLDFRWEDISAAQRAGDCGIIEPYVVVLGTLEPRKNGRIVLDFLAKNPEFAKRNRVVFIGRDGWLDERNRILAYIADLGIPSDRVVFTGFVSEREKISLLYHARFCIYPSFFEGFGLPILEAAVLGKTVVCSNTSSMPEVAPEKCYFFDPNSLSEFASAMKSAEREASLKRVSTSLEDVMNEAAKHDWAACYEEIKRWVLS
jgi:glycosyltransferase involved in cell wall biosynthesis